jgi:flagellar biosynthesis protein
MNDRPRAPGRKAVALRYDHGKDSAPRVVAKGDRLRAERIIEIARAHGVFIREDPDLVAMLATLEVGADIPPSLYRAVAEVLVFVYQLNRQMTPGGRRTSAGENSP